MRPRTTQRPYPPLFIAANSEDSVRSAARLGLPTLSSFFAPVAELQRRHTSIARQRSPPAHSLAEIARWSALAWGMRVVHVAWDQQEALQVTEGPFMSHQRRMSVLRSAAAGGSVTELVRSLLLRLRPFSDYLAGRPCAHRHARRGARGSDGYLDATGHQRVLLLMALPGLSTAPTLRSMRFFVDEVAPALTAVAHQ